MRSAAGSGTGASCSIGGGMRCAAGVSEALRGVGRPWAGAATGGNDGVTAHGAAECGGGGFAPACFPHPPSARLLRCSSYLTRVRPRFSLRRETPMLPTIRPRQSQFRLRPDRQAAGLVAGGARRRACSAARIARPAPRRACGEVIERSRALLGIPADYRIGILPGSDTGAFECAMWSLLGARGVDVLAFESFGEGWLTDIEKQLQARRRAGARARPMASCPTSARSIRTATRCSAGTAPPRACGCPTATGSATTAPGLTLCDATSAAFAMDLPWPKLDVVTWSWQKVLGGEAQHGMLVLSPRAVERLESYQARPGRCPSCSA